jgi:hypothetical protein
LRIADCGLLIYFSSRLLFCPPPDAERRDQERGRASVQRHRRGDAMRQRHQTRAEQIDCVVGHEIAGGNGLNQRQSQGFGQILILYVVRLIAVGLGLVVLLYFVNERSKP